MLAGALPQQLATTLRLHYRNRMGLLYGYVFPTIFLLAFRVLYRYETPPISRHLGELLTVTALSGACFALPTALVNERQRGVWRRYRLAPVSSVTLATSTLIARYALLLTAGALQVALAMLLGMPFPAHPADLWLAFTLVSFAMLGLGLVIAMLADDVPAVQALGQCVFLPMLMIGGIAVRLERLPEWAQHLSAFFPGRYAVQAIQAAVTGDGLGSARFPVIALVLIGGAAAFSGTKLFRWDSDQPRARGGKAWLAVALGAWVAVGVLAESTGFLERAGLAPTEVKDGGDVDLASIVRAGGTPAPAPVVVGNRAADRGVRPGAGSASEPESDTATPDTAAPAAPAPGSPAATPAAAGWRAVTTAEIEANVDFTGLPPDVGRVAPIAIGGYTPSAETECIRGALPFWEPANVADPVQRVRNYLLVAAVPDMLQMDQIEGDVPHLVFERMQRELPREELVRILYWIATHPYEGDDSAAGMLRALCIDAPAPSDGRELRERGAMYAVKLVGRLLGKVPAR